MPFQPGNKLSKLADHRSSGRKPELSPEEHVHVNRKWAETVIASVGMIRAFILSKGGEGWDKDRLTLAWRVLDKHFPSAGPDMALAAQWEGHSGIAPHVWIELKALHAGAARPAAVRAPGNPETVLPPKTEQPPTAEKGKAEITEPSAPGALSLEAEKKRKWREFWENARRNERS